MKIKIIFVCLLFFSLGLKIDAHSPKQKKAIRAKIVQTARNLLGYKGKSINIKDKRFLYDCSGFVFACYYNAGLNLNKIIKDEYRSKDKALSLYKSARTVSWKNHQRRPKPGDLVFFDNTYDRNKNKRWDDRITHVGLVEKVFPDGRIVWIHLVRKGIVRYVMHPGQGQIYAKGKTKLNDFLRRRPPTDRRKGRYLSGYLFSSFASPISSFR